MKKSKMMKLALGITLATTCAISCVAALTIELPNEPMSVESNDGTRYLTTTAQRASSEIPLVLGINIVGGNLFDGTLMMAGTSVNDNPDPYVWNYNYLYPTNEVSLGTSYTGERREGTEDFDSNTYYQIISSTTSSEGMANANGLYSSGGANQVMSTALEEYGGVSYGVYKQIDVWIGFNSDVLEQIDYIQNEMDSESEYYQEGYATYDPLIIDVSTGTITSRAYAWVEMGNALSAYLEEHPELSVRYGDPAVLCYNIQEFAFGIPYYIDSLIASGKIEKIKGAWITGTVGDGSSATTVTLADPAGLGNVKADAYAVGNTVDWLEGTYTIDQLLEEGIGVIIIGSNGYSYITGGNGGQTEQISLTRASLEGLLEEAGFTAENAPVVIDAQSESVTYGTNGYNYAPTTPLYVPYITAYMYMEQLSALAEAGDEVAAAINPTALFQYAGDEFFHIKDDSAYTLATYYIGTNWDATDSALDKVPVVSSGDFVYDKEAIVEAIQIGIRFALANTDNEDIYLNGAYRQGETAYTLAQMVVESGVDSFAEILAAADGDYSDITYEYENNQVTTTLDITALVSYYGEDGLAALVDDYVAHMDAHPWQPDTTIEGTYGYGLTADDDDDTTSVADIFPDVKEGAWYVDYVQEVFDAGLMEGNAEGTFGVGDNLTRAQAAVIAVNVAGLELQTDAENLFSDVPASSWYADWANTAAEAGLVAGYENGTFRGDQPVTRGEFAIMMVRALGINPDDYADAQLSFTDTVSGWAKAFVAAAVDYGMMEGYPDGTIRDSSYIVREEAATMLTHTL